MTAQIRDVLIVGNNMIDLLSEPLRDYLDLLDSKPVFKSTNSGCWRGYIAVWKLRGKSLYLNNLYLQNYEKENPGIGYLFPGKTSVFAEWFSGELVIPNGVLLQYVHMGYNSVYEKILLLKFEKGRLVSHSIIKNEVDTKLNDFDYDSLPF